VFKSFTHCPECGKPVDKFEITKRNAERKKGHYEYSFFHDKSRCVLPIDYEAVYPQANVIIEELIMPKLEELFSAFPHCPYCGNICKGIENVTESGESPHLYQKIKH
jgi:ssDNA-binding Zn-finger/Zn-ribbon topoisomerase 1